MPIPKTGRKFRAAVKNLGGKKVREEPATAPSDRRFGGMAAVLLVRKRKKFLRKHGVADKDRLIVLCPGGNWGPKRWPKKNFAQLADMLAEGLSAKIVLSGAKKDAVLVEEIRGMMKSSPVVSCGLTTLKELGALLERADLVVANDSGPMHLAVAMKSNVIALFGPTSPGLTGPYGKGNYRVIWKTKDCDPSAGSGSHPEALEGCEVPCYDVTCIDNRCMKLITVEEVFKESEEMLKQCSIRDTQNAKKCR